MLGAIYTTLKWAWEKGERKVWIMSDSEEAINWIQGDDELRDPSNHIARTCKNFINKDWEVRIVQISREMNKVVDKLAKLTIRRKCEWIEIGIPYRNLQRI